MKTYKINFCGYEESLNFYLKSEIEISDFELENIVRNTVKEVLELRDIQVKERENFKDEDYEELEDDYFVISNEEVMIRVVKIIKEKYDMTDFMFDSNTNICINDWN